MRLPRNSQEKFTRHLFSQTRKFQRYRAEAGARRRKALRAWLEVLGKEGSPRAAKSPVPRKSREKSVSPARTPKPSASAPGNAAPVPEALRAVGDSEEEAYFLELQRQIIAASMDRRHCHARRVGCPDAARSWTIEK